MVQLDVTPVVQAAKASGKSRITFVLRGAAYTTSRVGIFSSKESATSPALVIVP